MDPISIIQKYYNIDSPAYHILLQHSQDVTNKAVEVCQRHPELNADISFVYQAAMLHDIGIIYTNAPKIGCNGINPYILHGFIGAELMRKEGFPLHAQVCERHTGTGLTKEDIQQRHIPLPDGIYTPKSIEEKIICYADKFYSKTHLGKEKTFEEIIKSLSKHSNNHAEKFTQWHVLFR